MMVRCRGREVSSRLRQQYAGGRQAIRDGARGQIAHGVFGHPAVSGIASIVFVRSEAIPTATGLQQAVAVFRLSRLIPSPRRLSQAAPHVAPPESRSKCRFASTCGIGRAAIE